MWGEIFLEAAAFCCLVHAWEERQFGLYHYTHRGGFIEWKVSSLSCNFQPASAHVLRLRNATQCLSDGLLIQHWRTFRGVTCKGVLFKCKSLKSAEINGLSSWAAILTCVMKTLSSIRLVITLWVIINGFFFVYLDCSMFQVLCLLFATYLLCGLHGVWKQVWNMEWKGKS